MGGELHVRLMGGFDVHGLDEHTIGSRKARRLLKVLTLARGRPVDADRLAEILWPEDKPADPRAQVAVLASRLRRELGPDRLVRRDEGYVLIADWTDVVELENRVAEAEARLSQDAPGAARAAARAALDLARGPLLPDEDGDWVQGERTAVERLVARARIVGAHAALAAGDPADAAAGSAAALDADPYDEEALRILMRAHVAAGRPAAAVAAYERIRAVLAEELGVDPALETQELHVRVLRNEAGERRVEDPSEPPIGRETAWADLDGAMASGGGVVLVEGEAGIGKTTVVTSWARRVQAGGAVVLWGRCDELGREMPLQPLLDALDAHLSAMGEDETATLLGPEAAVVAPLVGRAVPDGRTSVDLGGADASRAVLYSALLSVFKRLSKDGPAVVVVEDVHMAAPATIEWLQLGARRGHGLCIVATARPPVPPLSGVTRIALGPLTLEATVRLVGADRAESLYERSGGHPLFLTELAAAPDDALPASVRDAVVARTEALGPQTAAVLRAASVIGHVVDLDLLATVMRLPASQLLAELELGAEARLLEERGDSFAFVHELVREALEAGTTASRRALLHRDAARALAVRSRRDPLDVAWHARLGGDVELAVEALAEAGDTAAARFDLREADRLFTEGIALLDGVAVRMGRARVRYGAWNLSGAMEDVKRAIALGAGPDALELAGWVAYHGRDYDAALSFADEALSVASDDGLRISCLSLAGRVRHSRGDLDGASALLEAASERPGAARSALASVWLGSVRLHQGRLGESLAIFDRAFLISDRFPHPFARLHGLFGRAYALAGLGRVDEALRTLDELDAAAAREDPETSRFAAVSANMRSWVLRNIGLSDEADACTSLARELEPLPQNAEPRYAGHLDAAEGRLIRGHTDEAAQTLDSIATIEQWEGTMAWRQRHRYRLLRARLALAAGDHDRARETAAAVAADAGRLGSSRHAVLARLTTFAAEAKAGVVPDLVAVADDLACLDRCGALEAWRMTAELASLCRVDEWRQDADRRVAALLTNTSVHADTFATYARRTLDALRVP